MRGIKSKERVKVHGEVFTPDSIVCDMVDLVDKKCREENYTMLDYIGRTCLEPACGNGNFLIRLLDRKLYCVNQLPEEKREVSLLIALSSIYGVDIQSDNVEESKERMMELIKNGEVELLERDGIEKRPFANGGAFNLSPDMETKVKFILDKNIVVGNALEKNEERATKMIMWNFDFNKETIRPRQFSLANLTSVDLNNEEMSYKDILKANYVYDDSLGDDW